MILDEKKIGLEKKALEFKIEEIKKLLFSHMGMLDALEQLEKLAPEPETLDKE